MNKGHAAQIALILVWGPWAAVSAYAAPILPDALVVQEQRTEALPREVKSLRIFTEEAGTPLIVMFDDKCVATDMWVPGHDVVSFPSLPGHVLLPDGQDCPLVWRGCFAGPHGLQVAGESWTAAGQTLCLYDVDYDSRNLTFLEAFLVGRTGPFVGYALGGQEKQEVNVIVPVAPGRYVGIGEYDKMYFHPLALTTGDFPCGQRWFSVLMEKGEATEAKSIQQRGKKDVCRMAVTDGASGVIWAAWWEAPASPNLGRTGCSVCVSSTTNGRSWTRPERLYSARLRTCAEESTMDYLDLCEVRGRAVVTWAVVSGGLMTSCYDGAKWQDGIAVGGTEDLVLLGCRHEPVSWKTVLLDEEHVTWVWLRNREVMLMHKGVASSASGQWEKATDTTGAVTSWDAVADEHGVLHLAYAMWLPDRAEPRIVYATAVMEGTE